MSDNKDQLTFMAVHAHPDDEVFGTGATMARLSAEGVRTVLITCTRGECGEIVDPNMDEEAKKAAFANLGEVREAELREAVAYLGITELRFLGFRDSGMVGTADNNNPECFHQANFDDAVKRLVKYIREFRPQVLVTYNPWGGYGHPDHIQAHRVTVAAFSATGDKRFYPDLGLEPFAPSKLYYTSIPRSMLRAASQEALSRGINGPWNNPAFELEEFGDPDEVLTAVYDGREYFDAKKKAFTAHKTQIAPDNFMFTLPDDMMREGMGHEYFQLALGKSGPIDANDNREHDLFAGLR
jgi:N-acetyl-1-D-myo-inositol-2-amino-2-deoxy-alpha-D-glucopyranoside deacetylase